MCILLLGGENMSISIQRKEKELTVQFNYSVERVQKVKTIEGARWDIQSKMWFIPDSAENLKKLKNLFCSEKVQIVFEPDTRDMHIIKLVQEQLKLEGYSHKTNKTYTNHLKRFSNFTKKSFIEITETDVRQYLLFLLEEEKCSHSYVNQAVSSIKFLYGKVLREIEITTKIPRPKKENKLPNVLSQEEVMKILQSLENEKHKTILFLIYSGGLRVGEVVRLQLDDVDSKRMLLRIKQGKGRKDRYTTLSQHALEQLRKYYKLYYPKKWLFEGGKENSFITERSVQRIFEKACDVANIKRKVSTHTLSYQNLNKIQTF